MTCEKCIPALDVNPDNPFVVDAPTSFDLPQVNPYCADFSVKQITLMIAGFLALAGLSPTAAQLETNAETFSCLPQDLQVPAVLWTLGQVLANIQSLSGGLVFTGDYGGAEPPFSPTSAGATATDSVTIREWTWVDGSWS